MTVGRERTESWAWGQTDATTSWTQRISVDDRTVQLTEWVWGCEDEGADRTASCRLQHKDALT